MPARVEPVINGHRYSYASVEVMMNGLVVVAVKRVSYGSSTKLGVIYGSDAQKVGRTPGEVEHRCEIELLRREWLILMETLGQSYGRKAFDVIVQYAEEGEEGVTTDSVLGCRITDVESANDEGPEPSAVALTLDPMDIKMGRQQLSIEVNEPPETTELEVA